MQIGRNERCPCGSGKKHKKCCLTSSNKITASSEPVSIGFSSDSIELLWSLYKKTPTNQLIITIAQKIGNGATIDKLHDLLQHDKDNTQYLIHLINALLNENRFLDSAHYCNYLLKLSPSSEVWYILGVTAAYRNDLATLNTVCEQLNSSNFRDSRLIIIQTAALFCARQLLQAIESAFLMLEKFPNNIFANEVAAYIAIEMQNTKLMSQVVTKNIWSKQVNPKSNLAIRAEKLIRSGFLNLLSGKAKS